MTRKEAIKALVDNRETIFNYKMEQVDEYTSIGLVTRSDEGRQYRLALELVDKIYDEHQAQMKAKDEEIKFLKSQINAKPTPEDIIAKIRNSFYHATVVYTRGSCGQLYKILKEIFPDAEAYENGDHVITKIGYTFYDINGKVSQRLLQDFKPCKAENKMLSHRFGNDLQHIQCPNCDEVFYCGDDEPKDNA